MVGYLLAGAVATALVLLWVGDLRQAGARLERRRRRLLTRYSGSAATALTLFAIISNADVVVARLSGSLGHHVAGLYSAASMSSRLILTGSAAVVTVLFPRVSVLSNRVQERLHLRAGAATVALLGGVAVAVSFAWGEPLIRLVFGGGYSRSATWLGPLCIAMALYSVANVYVFHFLSLDRARLPLLLSGVLAIELVAFGLLHSSPRELVLAQVISAVALIGACELFEHLRRAEAQA
jgi:O-antigen/teichoic acid export membrane protein